MNRDAWLASGDRIPVELASGTFEIFCRSASSGSSLTFLHGFPTSSWDWAHVAPILERQFRSVALDFLGFGDSDKPRGHRYSIAEQADVVEAIWRLLNVDETVVVAHDYGATVAQELLARREQDALAVALTAAVLLNSALYADLARPLPVQRLLATPLLGAVLARLVTERVFARSLSSVVSSQHALRREELRAQWRVVRSRGGVAAVPRLLSYIAERRRHAARWEGALERADLPVVLLWGMADPRSGAAIAERVQARVPTAHVVPLADVGHYPQLEVPALVADELASLAEGAGRAPPEARQRAN